MIHNKYTLLFQQQNTTPPQSGIFFEYITFFIQFHITKIRDFTELSGENIILIHRLLKNSIKSNEYWLFTKQFSKFLEKFQDYEIEKISQKLENFGKIELDFINFNETEETYVERSLLSKVINFPKMLIYYK